MSETKLQSKSLKLLKQHGYWAFKTVICNRSGIMDIIACSPAGQFVGIELKFGNNTATELQNYNIKEVQKRGGIAFVAWSLDDIKEGLNL